MKRYEFIVTYEAIEKHTGQRILNTAFVKVKKNFLTYKLHNDITDIIINHNDYAGAKIINIQLNRRCK